MTLDLWNMLHDGEVVKINLIPPDTLSLTIEIEYLRHMFGKDGDHIVVKLKQNSLLEFEYNNTTSPIKRIGEIESIKPIILSAEQIGNKIKIYGGNGVLWLQYQDFDLMLDNGRSITLEELGSQATAYWDNFGKKKEKKG